MATYYLPDVTSATVHEELQRTVQHYPTCSYDEWRHLQTLEIVDLLASKHKVRLVEVIPREFSDYCGRTGARRDVATFTGFLWDKGKRLGHRCARPSLPHDSPARL